MKTRQLRNLSFRKIVKHKNLSFRKKMLKKNLSTKQTAKRKNKRTRKLQDGGALGADDIIIITVLSLTAAVLTFVGIMAIIQNLEYIRTELIPMMLLDGGAAAAEEQIGEEQIKKEYVSQQDVQLEVLPPNMVDAIDNIATTLVAGSLTGGIDDANVNPEALDAAKLIVKDNNSKEVDTSKEADTTNNDKLDKALKKLNSSIFYIRLLKWMFSKSFIEKMIRQAARKVLRITGNCSGDVYTTIIYSYINDYNKTDSKDEQINKIKKLNKDLINCKIEVDKDKIRTLTNSLSNANSQTELLKKFQDATSTQPVTARSRYFTLPTLPNLSGITKYLPINYFKRNPLDLLKPKGISTMLQQPDNRKEAAAQIEKAIDAN
jgi:hypothetical protein